MNNFFPLLRKDLLELVRSRRLLVMTGFFLVMALASPILAKLAPEILKSVGTGQSGIVITLPEPSSKDAVDQYVKNLGGMGVLIIIFLAAGTIADEKARHSMELVLTKPVERVAFVLSKLTATLLALTICNILAALVFVSYTLSIFPNLDVSRFMLLAASLAVYLLCMATLAMAASTIASSGLAASGMAIIVYASLEVFSALIPRIKEYMPSYINGSYPDIMTGGWNAAFTHSAVASLLLMVILTIASISVFRRQEIER